MIESQNLYFHTWEVKWLLLAIASCCAWEVNCWGALARTSCCGCDEVNWGVACCAKLLAKFCWAMASCACELLASANCDVGLVVTNICWLGASIWAVGAMLTAGQPETAGPVETVAIETGTVATLAVTVRITWNKFSHEGMERGLRIEGLTCCGGVLVWGSVFVIVTAGIDTEALCLPVIRKLAFWSSRNSLVAVRSDS